MTLSNRIYKKRGKMAIVVLIVAAISVGSVVSHNAAKILSRTSESVIFVGDIHTYKYMLI